MSMAKELGFGKAGVALLAPPPKTCQTQVGITIDITITEVAQ